MSKNELESVIAETMEKTLKQTTIQTSESQQDEITTKNKEKQQNTICNASRDKYCEIDRNYEYNDTEYALSYFSLIMAILFCNPFVNSCLVCKFNKSRDPRVRRYNVWLMAFMILSWILVCFTILSALLAVFFTQSEVVPNEK
jgi:hypothetical protein